MVSRISTVVQMPKTKRQKDDKTFECKWGKQVTQQGFSMIPSLLFRAQSRLGLNPTQLAIILHIADFWWEKENKPYPGKEKLAARLGISARQIQRHIAELEKAGLVKRIERRAAHGGKMSNSYDLSGLVERLKALAPEFKEADEEAQEIKEQVSRRGGLRARKKLI